MDIKHFQNTETSFILLNPVFASPGPNCLNEQTIINFFIFITAMHGTQIKKSIE